jgi:glyoxylase-like metal-dependent hydrolase (beta-lactamase superfamily II)
MRELRPGVWHWQAPHPEWTPEAPYGQNVSSCAIDDGERLLLFDPLAVPDELLARREPTIVLTAPWHERDTQNLVERLGLPVLAPPPDSAQDLMEKFGITAEQAGDGSPDLSWLRESDTVDAHLYSVDERPAGMQVFAGRCDNDVILWHEGARAVIAGDSLADFGDGIQIVPGWLPKGVTRDDVAARLRPLLDLPVELVLPAHGKPTDRSALERVLS